MKNICITILAVLITGSLYSQTKITALFLGNSYTGVNSLPQLTATLALSAGDSLIYDNNTPGGYTLEAHSTNTISLSKIAIGTWDFVILQDQSQNPAQPDSIVQVDVFPFATFLDSCIIAANSCAESMFYMTWGRKNGDSYYCPTWPPVCSYEGMDSLLYLRYMMMADSNNALVSPVGAVWHYIRDNYPGIELYQVDESHPSLAGSYAAACCFYTSMFRKNPLNITDDYSLSASDASNIRNAVKIIVYDSLAKWNIGEYDPIADFSFSPDINYQVHFTNLSSGTGNWFWNFGDGSNSSLESPSHTYLSAGQYTVKLVAGECLYNDSIEKNINASLTFIENTDYKSKIYPNPAKDMVYIYTEHNNLIELFTLDGKLIYAITVQEERSKIDLNGLKKALYYVKISGNNTYEIHPLLLK